VLTDGDLVCRVRLRALRGAVGHYRVEALCPGCGFPFRLRPGGQLRGRTDRLVNRCQCTVEPTGQFPLTREPLALVAEPLQPSCHLLPGLYVFGPCGVRPRLVGFGHTYAGAGRRRRWEEPGQRVQCPQAFSPGQGRFGEVMTEGVPDVEEPPFPRPT